MNEIGLIRRQLATEQAHALEVIAACAAALATPGASAAADGAHLEALAAAARAHLACVIGSFARREERLAALVRRMAAGDSRRRALDAALAAPGASRDAQALLDAQSWPALAAYLQGAWSTRRAALETSLGDSTPVTEWREIAVIDADSVLEERTRYARVRAAASGPGRS